MMYCKDLERERVDDVCALAMGVLFPHMKAEEEEKGG